MRSGLGWTGLGLCNEVLLLFVCVVWGCVLCFDCCLGVVQGCVVWFCCLGVVSGCVVWVRCGVGFCVLGWCCCVVVVMILCCCFVGVVWVAVVWGVVVVLLFSLV